MKKSRLEAFSDGLFAVVITIMVLELAPPHGVNLNALVGLVPIFLSYVLSFIYVAIFWINHHNLLAITRQVNTAVLWGNLHFLFWVSLIPFFTSWVDENHVSPVPVASYGVILMICVISYWMLERLLIRAHSGDVSIVRQLRRAGRRQVASIVAFVVAILMSAVHPFISLGVYIAIAIVWMRPDSVLDDATSME